MDSITSPSPSSSSGHSKKIILVALLVVALAAGGALFYRSGGSLSGLFKGSFNAPTNTFVVTLDAASKDASGVKVTYTISNEIGSAAESGMVVRIAASSASSENVLLAEKPLDNGAGGTTLRNLESVTYSVTIPVSVFPNGFAPNDIKSVSVRLIKDAVEFGKDAKDL